MAKGRLWLKVFGICLGDQILGPVLLSLLLRKEKKFCCCVADEQPCVPPFAALWKWRERQ
jgi:hypothetical protein